MGLGGAIEAGRAFVKFLLDDKELTKGLAGIGTKLRKVGSIGLAATLPILGAMGGFALLAGNVGGELTDMSKRTGLSVESLGELGFAAKQTGASMADVEKAAHFLQKRGLDPNKFQEIAERVAAIEDPTARAQAAMKEFGKKTGPALLPMIDGLAEARKKAHELGLVMSTEDAAAADDFGDALDVAKEQVKFLGINIGLALVGPLTDFLVWSQGALASVIEWIHEHPNLVRAFVAAAAAIAVASAAALFFGGVLTLITLHPIVAFLTLLAGLLVGLAVYFGFGNKQAAEFKKSLGDLKLQNDALNKSLATPGTAGAGGSLEGVRTRPARSVSPGAARQANNLAGGGVQEVIKWTRQTAEGIGQMTALLREGSGFLVGSG